MEKKYGLFHEFLRVIQVECYIIQTMGVTTDETENNIRT